MHIYARIHRHTHTQHTEKNEISVTETKITYSSQQNQYAGTVCPTRLHSESQMAKLV